MFDIENPFLAICVVLGVCLGPWICYFIVQLILRYRAVRKYGKRPLDVYYGSVANMGIRRETFYATYENLARCYRVDAEYLSPRLEMKVLFQFDSCFLNSGTRKLNIWFNSVARDDADGRDVVTILDLLKYIETHPLLPDNTKKSESQALN